MTGYRLRHSGDPFAGEVRLPGSKHEFAHKLAIACMQPSGALSNVAETQDSAALIDCVKLIFERVSVEQNVLSFSEPRLSSNTRLSDNLTARSRNIYCMLPALLKWSGSVSIEGRPTGCPFEYRPFQWYFETLEKAGVEIRLRDQGEMNLRWIARRAATFAFAYPSVTATVIALAAGTQSPSETIIHGASNEPSVISAMNLAMELGHAVDLQGRECRIAGVVSERSARTTIAPDLEVAASLLSGLIMTGGTLRMKATSVIESSPLRRLFHSLGVAFVDADGALVATYEPGAPLPPTQRYFGPAPMTPSDWAPMLAIAFLGSSRGESHLIDTLFADRFDYLRTSPEALRSSFKLTRKKIGDRSCASLQVVNPMAGRLKEDSRYRPHDLRGAAASVLSCLRSEGWVHVTDDTQLRRGYEDLIGDISRLTALDVEPIIPA